jgi:hypothetical protein
MVAYLERCCGQPIRIDARLEIEEPTLMAQILPFVRRRNAFDADATSAMGEAYDKAIGTIHPDAESQFVIRELIAKRIIQMARKGVVDRDQLCTSATQTAILFVVCA